MNHLIAPSVLAAKLRNLQADFDMVNRSEADWFHVDVMDGRFVPNISFGMDIVKTMKSMAERPLDVHLMILEPEKYIGEFCKAGADVIAIDARGGCYEIVDAAIVGGVEPNGA